MHVVHARFMSHALLDLIAAPKEHVLHNFLLDDWKARSCLVDADLIGCER